jgi:hypothetical protein
MIVYSYQGFDNITLSRDGYKFNSDIYFAFGVADFWHTETIQDPYEDFGSLFIQYEFWNETYNEYIPVETRPCTPEDFGAGENKTSDQIFYDIDPGKKDELLRKIAVYKCMKEPVNLIGNWNTAAARVLEVYFVKCDPTKRDTCKSDEELTEWMRNKYFWFTYNR